jgi:hypothetical protein
MLTTFGLLSAAEPPLHDPMRPYQVAPQAGPGISIPRRLELSAILVSSQRRIAVINKHFYREGDVVDGAEVIRIHPEFVQLRRGSENLEVRLIRGSTGAQSRQGVPAS